MYTGDTQEYTTTTKEQPAVKKLLATEKPPARQTRQQNQRTRQHWIVRGTRQYQKKTG